MARVISLKDAPAWVATLAPRMNAAAKRGAMSAAIRGVGIIQSEIIPKLSPLPVDRGIWRAAWRAEKLADGAAILNDAPHAGFIENGVRAGAVKPGRAMIDALAEWVRRKGLASSSTEARGIAFAIARSMQKRGIFAGGKGFHVLDTLAPRLKEIFAEEVRLAIEEDLGRK